MRYFLFLTFICITIAACQKEINFGGSTNQLSTVRCTSCNYLPVCDSTSLTYVDSSAMGNDTIQSTLTILGDTIINGKKFTEVSPFAAFNQGLLYNCDGGDYRIYQPVPDLGIDIDSLIQSLGLPVGTVTIPSHIETTILKSGSNAGSTWSDTIFQFSPLPFVTVVASLDYKLEAKGISRSVLNKLFTNVIHVSSQLNIVIPLLPLPLDVRVDYYFAEGIGIIETKAVTNGVLQSQTKLLAYKIK